MKGSMGNLQLRCSFSTLGKHDIINRILSQQASIRGFSETCRDVMKATAIAVEEAGKRSKYHF